MRYYEYLLMNELNKEQVISVLVFCILKSGEDEIFTEIDVI